METTMLLLAAAGEPFDWTALATNLGFGAFVMWFAWHTQTHTIPSILTQHKEEREMARKDFLGALAECRKDYLESEHLQRDAYLAHRIDDRADLKHMVDAVAKLAEATQAHVSEARTVWKLRGELPK